VTEAALNLGEICLAGNDSEGAVSAATRGLLASPAHTLLTELLMRAHALAGDHHASDRVYENHVNALQALDLDEVAESTLDLHAEHSLRGAAVLADCRAEPESTGAPRKLRGYCSASVLSAALVPTPKTRWSSPTVVMGSLR